MSRQAKWLRWGGGLLGGLILAGWLPDMAWARPVLNVSMTLGLSVSADYWYVVAISSASQSGPRANLVDPNVSTSGDAVTFVSGWDHLIRVKPLNNEEALVQSTIETSGSPEREFASGFNEVNLSKTTRERDTINLVIDLEDLGGLDPVNSDIHVALLTINAPFRVDVEETSLALDATKGISPHYYRLSLSDQRQVLVDDPQRQETVRRSRELIENNNAGGVRDVGALVEGGSLGILAANILTFSLELTER
ncbi:MAG: hypothetical protein NW237_00460 [Cyanobacteriota bacterium]|nr:hypothetical protein [Cyanobacteriota bacterium]